MNDSKQRNVGVKRLTDPANDALWEIKRIILNSNEYNADTEHKLRDGKIIEIALKKYLEELKQKDNRK